MLDFQEYEESQESQLGVLRYLLEVEKGQKKKKTILLKHILKSISHQYFNCCFQCSARSFNALVSSNISVQASVKRFRVIEINMLIAENRLQIWVKF